jgi:hypothetical protein
LAQAAGCHTVQTCAIGDRIIDPLLANIDFVAYSDANLCQPSRMFAISVSPPMPTRIVLKSSVASLAGYFGTTRDIETTEFSLELRYTLGIGIAEDNEPDDNEPDDNEPDDNEPDDKPADIVGCDTVYDLHKAAGICSIDPEVNIKLGLPPGQVKPLLVLIDTDLPENVEALARELGVIVSKLGLEQINNILSSDQQIRQSSAEQYLLSNGVFVDS